MSFWLVPLVNCIIIMIVADHTQILMAFSNPYMLLELFWYYYLTDYSGT